MSDDRAAGLSWIAADGQQVEHARHTVEASRGCSRVSIDIKMLAYSKTDRLRRRQRALLGLGQGRSQRGDVAHLASASHVALAVEMQMDIR